MPNPWDPEILASFHRDAVRDRIRERGYRVRVIGLLTGRDPASRTYAEYTRARCVDAGLDYDLIEAPPEALRERIEAANRDASIHGIFVYFPVFGDGRDAALREAIAPTKDVEGLSPYWMRKLYANERYDDPAGRRKCLLPCTPLAVLKILEQMDVHADTGLPLQGTVVSIFNRSDVVGRPLAHMLANDGAKVHSFDLDGGLTLEPGGRAAGAIGRAAALAESHVVITAVPSKSFDLIRPEEVRPGAIGVNIASVRNFTDEAKDAMGVYVPRVGPVTVAMCLRNALRLYEDHRLDRGRHAAN